DHFKKLNDRYGHDMGDKVLRTFAAMLAMNLRDEDIFARLGGEEFVVVCRRQPIEGVCAFADKLRRLASQCSFSADDDISISVSIGGAIVLAGEELSDTLKRADEALYTAKQNGRNRVEFDTRR
ncbi:MAG TPA: GGDEF domain-containing protein, partial [Cellvibrionaceae bacterium]|nr:GGDEF domain-containing protein [Cellvibrionaceae bacterium]